VAGGGFSSRNRHPQHGSKRTRSQSFGHELGTEERCESRDAVKAAVPTTPGDVQLAAGARSPTTRPEMRRIRKKPKRGFW
jgi:hypothetical protein